MRHKILVVDDEQDICIMLKDYLQLEGYLVYTANNGKEAMEQLAILPDLILLDINMPEMDGLEFCKKVRNHVNIPIIFLTARIEDEDRINGLMVGGDDYILKPFNLQELKARIVAHLRREERSKSKMSIRCEDSIVINYDERKVYSGENEIKFTKTEFDIIDLLSNNIGKIFDRETIYERLWGYDKDGDSAIIMEHIRRIRKKFSDVVDKEMIETVWGVGYRWKA